MSFIDILIIIAILAYGVLSGWIIYKMMKSADENEDDEEQESDEKE